MNTSPVELIQAFRGLKVLVLGDAMLDSYLSGPTGRLCPEAPVPVVDVVSQEDFPGGAANSAVNIRSLGATPVLLSTTGDDAEGDLLRRVLEEQEIESQHLLRDPARRTLAKHRVMSGGHLLVRFDQGSTHPIEAIAEAELLARVRALVPECDAVIVSDYGYGTVTPKLVALLAELQAQAPRVVVVDSKNLTAFRPVGVTAVKPNYREMLQLVGAEPCSGERLQVVAAHGEQILELTGARIAAITCDRDGAFVFERGGSVYRTYARPAPQFHAAGAGDTFLVTFALALAVGAGAPMAAELAAAAAGVVVRKEHTATCSAAELVQAITGDCPRATDLACLVGLVESHRRQGRRIVLTNGCFDILHRGHIAYLHRAKSLGDILVVGVNSDESIRRLKGPTRPINSLEDRLGVLSALSCIDYLVAFDEDTPHRLIEAIRPDLFVKGGDYTRDTLPEASLVEQLGGSVKILPFVSDRSTTNLIERICDVYAQANEKTPRYPGDHHVRRPLDRRQEPVVR